MQTTTGSLFRKRVTLACKSKYEADVQEESDRVEAMSAEERRKHKQQQRKEAAKQKKKEDEARAKEAAAAEAAAKEKAAAKKPAAAKRCGGDSLLGASGTHQLAMVLAVAAALTDTLTRTSCQGPPRQVALRLEHTSLIY